ncbi:MAG: ROK family protein [Verrucomicrobiae bacterium]|nr:ROK family protein [Verrucomicrobiae bacterium]
MSEANTVLGIDMGGTGIKSASLRFPDGQCLHQKIAPTRDGETVDGVPAFVAEISQLIAWHEAELGHPLRYIGLSAPGLANRTGDAIAFMPGRLHGLEGLVWRDALQRSFPVPVINDGHAALLGEIWLGAANGLDDVVMYTLGTGVGGAIVCDGKLLRGRFGRAGHLGHSTVNFEGTPDICGTPGSIEDAIGEATVRSRSNGLFPSTKALVEAYAEGNPIATDLWLTSLRALAASIVSIINAVDPEAVVIGGGITSAGSHLFDPLNALIDKREWRPADARTRICKATLGTWAGAYGAAYGAWRDLG